MLRRFINKIDGGALHNSGAGGINVFDAHTFFGLILWSALHNILRSAERLIFSLPISHRGDYTNLLRWVLTGMQERARRTIPVNFRSFVDSIGINFGITKLRESLGTFCVGKNPHN